MKWCILFFITLFFGFGLVVADPFGATVNQESSERAPADAPTSTQAQAGNVTELNINGVSITQSWQGYFGNITGTIQLADASDNILYNWSLASPQGEVYASTNDSLEWSTIQCFNYTATGTLADDSTQAGNTSLYGVNITMLESQFNIDSDDVDVVDETFTLVGAGTHDLFYSNSLEFSGGECLSTRVFSDAGAGENDKFEEVLLYEPTTASVVFTSIIDEDVLGFDSAPHDFEMLVLEDGHGTNTDTTTYYFYVELE